jgi:hypothetical protein
MAIKEGTTDWFKLERLRLIEQIKAVDSFGAAARSFQKVVETRDADTEVSAALHTAGVVHYGRPFSNNRGGRVPFTKKVIKDHPKYDDQIHEQLMVLRNNLIAHSDQDYVDTRLFAKMVNIDRDDLGRLTVLAGVSLVTKTVHSLHDTALAERYLMQAKVAEEAARSDLEKRLVALTKAGRQFRGAFEAARTGNRPPIIAAQFQLTPDKPEANIPAPTLDPHAVLTPPPLAIGQDGYAYRSLKLDVNLPGGTWRAADGWEVSFAWTTPDQSQQKP